MRLLIAATLLIGISTPAWSQDTHDHHEAMRHLRLGEDSMRLEQWDSAEAEFRSAIRLEPSLEMAHYHLGQVYMATRRYPAAVRAYLGDGNFGGEYQKADAQMLDVWRAGVEETREALEGPWS